MDDKVGWGVSRRHQSVPCWLAPVLLLLACFPANAGDATNRTACSRPILVAASPLGRSSIIKPDGEVSGASRAAFDVIGEEAGCKFEYVVVPRARAWVMLQRGEVDVVTDAIPTPERDAYAYFVKGGTNYVALISLADTHLRIGSLAELQKSAVSLITVRGFDYGAQYRELLAELRARGRVYEATAPENAVAMLLGRRADALLMTPGTIVDAWEKQAPGSEPAVHELEGLPSFPYGSYFSKTRMLKADVDLIEASVLAFVRRGDSTRVIKRYYPAWVIDWIKPDMKPGK